MRLVILNETAYDEDDLQKFGIQFAMYYYEQSSSYEGLGICLAFKDNLWYTHDLGHCSCYGPFDGFNLKEPFEKLKDAIRDFHYKDWSRYFDFTIDAIYEEVKPYRTKTLFVNGEDSRVYLKNVF